MLSTPTQTEKYVSYFGSLPEINELGDTIFSDSTENQVLFKKISTQRTVFGSNLLPKKIQFSTEENPLEDRVYCNYYDDKGNPLEVQKANDISTVYIWGYRKTQLIAKIENATYTEVYANSGLITSIQNMTDRRQTSEEDLIIELNILRDILPKALITTYTYRLPFGLASITDPNGTTVYYSYDNFGRLKEMIDHEYNVIKQYEYNYSEQ
jgi:YD repeat-containing protein